MQSKATSVAEYLQELPEDRRTAMEAVRKVVLANVDANIAEGMLYGMIGYYVPHSVFPDGYHVDPRQPLPYACLASQKNHMALYLMSVYAAGDSGRWFRESWAKSGKKLDMGQSCIRFKRVEDLALDVIGEAIRRVPTQALVELYLANRPAARAARAGAGGVRPTAKKKIAKKKVAKKKVAARKPAAKKKKK